MITFFIQMFMFTLIWRRRKIKAALPLMGFLFAAGEWALTGAFEASSLQMQHKIFWAQMSYPGICFTPVFFFLFTIEYCQLDRIISRKRWKYFFIIPTITVLLAFTNQYHHLLWSKFTWSSNNVLIYWYGPYFWINNLYIYILLSSGILILFYANFKLQGLYKKQLSFILAGSIFPFAGNMIYILKIPFFNGLDLTPVAFAITASVLAFILLKYDFLDIVPIAHDLIFENISSGIAVLDPENRIIEINSNFRNWIDPQLKIGDKLSFINSKYSEFTALCEKEKKYSNEIQLDKASDKYYYLTISIIEKDKKPLDSKIIVITDISDQKFNERKLIETNHALNIKLNEIEQLKLKLEEQALRDPLTGVYNRRHLESVLSKEISRSQRELTEIAILMIDVDHFKDVNDSSGHSTGDEVLITLTGIIQSHLRKSDYLFRYGGDELVILLTNIGKETAFKKGEMIRDAIVKSEALSKHKVPVTLFIGISIYPENGKDENEVLKNADKALYKAKSEGRNKTVTYSYE